MGLLTWVKRTLFKDYGDYVYHTLRPQGYNDSGIPVNNENGSRITTVFNAINVVSQDVSVLPFEVRREDETIESNSPAYKLLNHRANPYMNAYHFRYAMTFLGEKEGDSYAWIEKNSRMEPVALYPFRQGEVKCEIEGGRPYYMVRGKRFEEHEIFHYYTFTCDGYTGTSKILFNAQNIGLKLKTHRYKTDIIGSSPAGYLTAENVKGDQAQEIAKGWKDQIESGKTPFLYGNVEYKHLMFSPEQTDIITSEKWTDTMTIAMWRVQPTMVSMHEDSNYSNAEQQDLSHVKYTLSAPSEAWEQEAYNKLLSERQKMSGYKCQLNYMKLLRGDTEARTSYYQFMRTGGIMNADEIRKEEGKPAQRGELGQKYFIQGAMADIEAPQEDIDNQRNKNILAQIEEALKEKNGKAYEGLH